MNQYCIALLLTCAVARAATFPDTSTDGQVIINSNNVSAGSSSLRWSFTDNRLTVGPTGLGSRVTVEGATPTWRLYAGGNPATSYSRLESFWDSGAQTYYLRENVSGSNAIPFLVGINGGAALTFNTDGTATHSGGVGLSGTTNRLSIVNDTLLLDGVAVASNTTTNTYNTVISTNNFFISGKGNTLIMTNYVRFPWTTLTMSGSNVSTLDLSAGSAFKLTLTNNAFFGAPTGLPGTNQAQTIQIALLQDGTGTRTVTLTNSAWLMSGSGTSTNAVPTINTNANAVTILSFVTSPFSATVLYGVPAAIGQ